MTALLEPQDLNDPALRDRAVRAARGQDRFDTLLTGGVLADVATGELRPADIGLVGPLIVSVHSPGARGDADVAIALAGKIVAPGLIDSHLHIESSMVTPRRYAEVVVPQGFNYMLADRAKAMTIAQWEHLGLARPGKQPFPHPTEKAYLLAPAGAEGPGFLMLQNFRVIMKYNPAEAYALAIGHFADRLRGGAPFVQPWPRQERELSRTERLELQQLLAQRGFYRGTPDGQFGGETREALRGFQASIGAPADGIASSDMLERLRGH